MVSLSHERAADGEIAAGNMKLNGLLRATRKKGEAGSRNCLTSMEDGGDAP